MAIAYTSTGQQVGVATETSGAALSPLCPSTVNAGDILIAHVYFEGTATTPSTPSGWTLLRGPDVIETSIGRHWIYGKVADGTEDSTAVAFGTPAVTTMRSARIYRFTGRISGAIADLVNGFSATSHATDPQMPSVTTTATGALAVACVVQNDNNALAAATGMSGGTWAEATAEFVAALTPGLVLQLQTCTPTANPGTVSGGAVAATNDPSGVIGFQIRDSAPQIITGAAVVRTRAFGTAKINHGLTANAPVIHTRAFGTAAIQNQGLVSWAQLQVPEPSGAVGQQISPSGVVHSRVIGSATVTRGAVVIVTTGVAHSRAIPGTHKIIVYVLPAAVVHTRAFGTAVVVSTQFITPGSVVHSRAFGTHSVASAAQVIQPSSVVHGRAFGSVVVNAQRGAVAWAQFQVPYAVMVVLPPSVVHGRAFGTATVFVSRIYPTGVVHTRVIGSLNVIGNQVIAVPSVVRTRAIGAADVVQEPHIAAAGLIWLFGDVDFGKIEPASVVHPRAIGSVKVSLTMFFASVVHTRGFGVPTVGRFVETQAVVHSRAIGAASLHTRVTTTSVIHTRLIETPDVGGATTTIAGIAVVHTRGFGSATVTISAFNQTILPPSVVRARNITGPIVLRAGDPSPKRQGVFSPEWGIDIFHPGDVEVEVTN